MYKRLLEYIENYVQLFDSEKKIITSTFKTKRYLKGQYIVQSGNIAKQLSFIVNGGVKSFFLDAEGKEHVVMLAIEDWWVSDLGSFTEESPADFDIQCLEDTSVIQITRQGLESLFTKIPKLERFFRIIILRNLIFTQKRIVANLSLPAKERYLRFADMYGTLEQRFPQYLVASYLGISKEFLSKIRNELTTKS